MHVRTFAGTKSILFRLRDCWHVPLSPHHFLSCKRVISQGKQVMLAGRTPRMIFSHNDRLAEPQSPKYVPFTQNGGNFVLNFQIPVEVSGVQPTVAPLLSLHATSFQPFAGMAALPESLNQHDPLLSTATQTAAHDAISLHPSSYPPFADPFYRCPFSSQTTSADQVVASGLTSDGGDQLVADGLTSNGGGSQLVAGNTSSTSPGLQVEMDDAKDQAANISGDAMSSLSLGDGDAQVALDVNEDGVVSDTSQGGAVRTDTQSKPAKAASLLNFSSRDFDFSIPIQSLDSVTLDPESVAQGSFPF